MFLKNEEKTIIMISHNINKDLLSKFDQILNFSLI